VQNNFKLAYSKLLARNYMTRREKRRDTIKKKKTKQKSPMLVI
jgi:hypothetical protein